jgi:hypothetical protein
MATKKNSNQLETDVRDINFAVSNIVDEIEKPSVGELIKVL